MKKLNHLELFENFPYSYYPDADSGTDRVYATCFQGDSWAAVGILNEAQRRKIQDAMPSFSDIRIETVDVTGMGYVLHDVDGDFRAMPKSTNPDDYGFYITKDGKMPKDRTIYYQAINKEDRLFELVKGSLLYFDHHSQTELLSVGEFIEKYIG